MALQPYEYSKLVDPDAFRVIVLEPSTELTATIKCSLITSTLTHYDTDIVDHYTALSYVWGDANDRRSIIVDGKQLDITASLDLALRHIRDSTRPLKVWADGICMDQKSDAEKNVQVKLMGSIYGLARHTIIFLGEATPESIEVFDTLLSSHPTFDTRRGSGLLANFSRPKISDVDPLTPSRNFRKAPSSEEIVYNDGVTTVFWHILNQPWFTRVWVLQELVLSIDPWVQLGGHRIRWNVFSDRFLSSNKRADKFGHNLKSRLKILSDMDAARQTYAGALLLDGLSRGQQHDKLPFEPSDSLWQLLHSRRGAGVSDPRDMIYAHLGIAKLDSENKGSSDYIKVDYGKPVWKVYADITLYFIARRCGFGILSFAGTDATEHRRKDLPSWVPDWTSPYVAAEAEIHLTEQFSFDGINLLYTGLNRSKILACIGTYVATIIDIRDEMPPAVDIVSLCTELELSGETEEKTIAEKIYRVALDQLRLWLGDANFLPELPKLLDFFPDDTPKSRIPGFSKFKDRVSQSLSGEQLPGVEKCCNSKIVAGKERDLVEEMMLSMTDTHGTGCFSGKKLAQLENKSYAFVPPSSHIGDTVYFFNVSPVPYVLRAVKSDEGSQAEMDNLATKFFNRSKKNLAKRKVPGRVGLDAKELLHEMDTSNVSHFELVGECFLDYLPNDFDYLWKMKKPQILALH